MMMPAAAFSGERTRLACWFRRHRRNGLLFVAQSTNGNRKTKFAMAKAPSPAREARALPSKSAVGFSLED